ncbi:hypothetical protein LSTR_LSTR009166 [Laodelphax striatellus]|uniref:N-acetyltransferase domain-containing protein n=1 Tax=Laodelphax striatellus TaxID=195883 RepID=A0A482XDE4_LAOST|nr:hypothetical protein LSTR_LSTR009166 [Laodelphax striatellus]
MRVLECRAKLTSTVRAKDSILTTESSQSRNRDNSVSESFRLLIIIVSDTFCGRSWEYTQHSTSAMVCDPLIELPEKELDLFCEEVLKKDWPNSIHVYYFIKTSLEWRKKKNLKIQLLATNTCMADGTFIGVKYSDNGSSMIVMYSLNDEALENAIKTSSKIDWSRRPVLEAILDRHIGVVNRSLAARGIMSKSYSFSGIYCIDLHQAANIEIPPIEDVKIEPVTDGKDLEYIYSVWAHNDIYSFGELLDTALLGGSFGVYSKENGLLMSWVMVTHYGGVGVLQSREDCLRKGYASLATRTLTKAMANCGITPHACIMDCNTRSRAFFEKLGYKRVAGIQYLTTQPM